MSGTKLEVIEDHFYQAFDVFKTDNLKGISERGFYQHIISKINSANYLAEGYTTEEVDKQRDLSVTFRWGHDHDFGYFTLKGQMGNRHISVPARFASLFPIELDCFDGKDVLDVGCWTGGTSLLLQSLGARVFAIEEVVKYADMVAFLAKSFGVDNKIIVVPHSLYKWRGNEYFDIVHVPGVLYHLSDPLVALRIMFNSLKVGGQILIESAGRSGDKQTWTFAGSSMKGWCWFIPTARGLARMMREVGFDDVKTNWFRSSSRIYAYGIKKSQKSMCKAGLSMPDIL